jgi:hypothetical protein
MRVACITGSLCHVSHRFMPDSRLIMQSPDTIIAKLRSFVPGLRCKLTHDLHLNVLNLYKMLPLARDQAIDLLMPLSDLQLGLEVGPSNRFAI